MSKKVNISKSTFCNTPKTWKALTQWIELHNASDGTRLHLFTCQGMTANFLIEQIEKGNLLIDGKAVQIVD